MLMKHKTLAGGMVDHSNQKQIPLKLPVHDLSADNLSCELADISADDKLELESSFTCLTPRQHS